MEVIYEGNTPFQQMIRVILGKGRNNVCKEVYESKYKNKESSVREYYLCPFRLIERERGEQQLYFARICFRSEFSSSWRYGVPLI
uniref:Mos1 transposase HTH domain-containing protein n=1 Tax=Parascaris univalens TaxID=6257 RepID=A0A915A1E7_PARUN